MKKPDIGLTAWQHSTNHNRMIEFQQEHSSPADSSETSDHKKSPDNNSSGVELTYFGSSAFQLTSPAGLTVMLDPWRNHPSRHWDWYFKDFPLTPADIGVSTHAHFDHDALHRLDASVLLDRLIGKYSFGDICIEGIADKHATDASAALYDFRQIMLDFDGIDITPPDNPRSWDNCLIVVETGGLRILHWGDNRHDPSDDIWQRLGPIDVLLIPIDDSQHVLSFESVDAIIEKLRPRYVVPHHYYIRTVTQRQSTLLPPANWLATHSDNVSETNSATVLLKPESDVVKHVAKHAGDHGADIRTDFKSEIIYFADHVNFDTKTWREAEE